MASESDSTETAAPAASDDAEPSAPTSVEDVTPRRAVTLLLGESATSEVILYLKGYRGVATWGELAAAIDYPFEEVRAAVRRLQVVNAVAEPKIGCFRLTHGPVGQELRDVCEETTKKAREVRGLHPTELPVRDE